MTLTDDLGIIRDLAELQRKLLLALLRHHTDLPRPMILHVVDAANLASNLEGRIASIRDAAEVHESRRATVAVTAYVDCHCDTSLAGVEP